MKIVQLLIAALFGCILTLSIHSAYSELPTVSDRNRLDLIDDAALMPQVTTAVANQMKRAYANQRVLLGKFAKSNYVVGTDSLSVTRDAQGNIVDAQIYENRELHSWWISKADLADIGKITNYSGVRLFPGVDRSSVSITDTNQTQFQYYYNYHTLVINGTVLSGGTNQNHSQSYQYVGVCPNQCDGGAGRFDL